MSTSEKVTVVDTYGEYDRMTFVDHGEDCCVYTEMKAGPAWRSTGGVEFQEDTASKLHTALGKWLTARGYDIR